MFCNQCGNQLKEGVRFCINCGTRMDDGPRPQAPKAATSAAGASSATEGSSPRPQTSSPKSLSGAHSGTIALGKSQPVSRSMGPALLWGGIVFVVSAVLLTAFLIYRRSPSDFPVPDAGIEKALQAKFAADPNLSKCTLGVRSRKGVVTLIGVVQTDADKSTAKSVAAQQEGVKQVNVY